MPKPTSEKTLEKKFSNAVDGHGGMSIKLLSSLMRGLPDRMALLQGGNVFFVEFKTTGKKPTKFQTYIHDKIRSLGFLIYVIDTHEALDFLLQIYDIPNR